MGGAWVRTVYTSKRRIVQRLRMMGTRAVVFVFLLVLFLV